MTPSHQALASFWGIPTFFANEKMQPAHIFMEFDIADAVFTTILLLAILFSLAWIIYLQELLNEWFLNALRTLENLNIKSTMRPPCRHIGLKLCA